MKKYFYFMAMAIAACVFTACSSDSDEEPGKDLPSPSTVVGTWMPDGVYDGKDNLLGALSNKYITGYDFDGYCYMYEWDNPTSSDTRRGQFKYDGSTITTAYLEPSKPKLDGNLMRKYLSDKDCDDYNVPKGSYFRYKYSPNVVPEGVWKYYAWYSFDDQTWYEYVPDKGEMGIISIFENELNEYYTNKKPDELKITNMKRDSDKKGSFVMNNLTWYYEYEVSKELNCGVLFLETQNMALAFTRYYTKSYDI